MATYNPADYFDPSDVNKRIVLDQNGSLESSDWPSNVSSAQNAQNAGFDHVADTGRSQFATQAFLSKQRVGKG
jgi:hypothetical protein